ncbi:methyltransferase-like protein 27 isoform X2 [Cherax quadricarinatus]|uniref:methyltransferase-like protein 27 isoform X2 n=1 Tax=Cherax quadricarinatus TaxID=27406 RepID=UPI00387E4811
MIPEEQRQQVRVLDVAAGTGWVGSQLHQKGFTNIDAVEPSGGMMNILNNTGVYTRKYQEFIGFGQCTVPEDSYDVVVVCGSLCRGHIPVEGINDMIQVAKPGGLVAILMRKECLLTAEEYKDKLEAHMDHLEKTNVWQKTEHPCVSLRVPACPCDPRWGREILLLHTTSSSRMFHLNSVKIKPRSGTMTQSKLALWK